MVVVATKLVVGVVAVTDVVVVVTSVIFYFSAAHLLQHFTR